MAEEGKHTAGCGGDTAGGGGGRPNRKRRVRRGATDREPSAAVCGVALSRVPQPGRRRSRTPDKMCISDKCAHWVRLRLPVATRCRFTTERPQPTELHHSPPRGRTADEPRLFIATLDPEPSRRRVTVIACDVRSRAGAGTTTGRGVHVRPGFEQHRDERRVLRLDRHDERSVSPALRQRKGSGSGAAGGSGGTARNGRRHKERSGEVTSKRT